MVGVTMLRMIRAAVPIFSFAVDLEDASYMLQWCAQRGLGWEVYDVYSAVTARSSGLRKVLRSSCRACPCHGPV